MQRVRVLWFALEYFPIASRRLGKAARPMLLEREREGLINALLRHRYCSTLARRGGTR